MQPKRIISYIDGYDVSAHHFLAERLNVEFCLYFMESEYPKHQYVTKNIRYIGRSRYPNMDDLKIESFNFELIHILSKHENTIYNLINRFDRRYKIKGSFNRLRSRYLSLVRLAENILISNQIDFVVFYDTPHQPLEYLIYLIAKENNIGVIVRRELPSLHKFRPNLAYCTLDYPLLDQRFNEQFNSFERKTLPDDLSPMVRPLFQEFQHYSSSQGKGLVESVSHYGKKFNFKDLNWYFSFRIKIIKNPILILAKSIRFFFSKMINNRLNSALLTRYYDKLSISADLTKKYFYFPLHFQPEATTNPLGGIFMDQFMTIRLIQTMLPKDTLLYVKEHPTYWRSNQIEGMHKVRSKRVYKEMSSLDGVKLLTVNSNPYELIFNSIGVITITGTSAFEAFGFNKPALVLGNYFYNQFANAYHPYTMDELRNALHEMTLKNNDYSDSFLATLKSLEKISISLTSNDPKVNKEAVIKMLADVILES